MRWKGQRDYVVGVLGAEVKRLSKVEWGLR